MYHLNISNYKTSTSFQSFPTEKPLVWKHQLKGMKTFNVFVGTKTCLNFLFIFEVIHWKTLKEPSLKAITSL